MAPRVILEIPGEIAHAARMTPQELKRELATHLFRLEKLSFGKARELAGMTVWAFQLWLGSQGIAAHYTLDEYETDVATLNAFRRP
jgi:predicted HTH domain antitoxin